MDVVVMMFGELSGQIFVGNVSGKYAETDSKDGGSD